MKQYRRELKFEYNKQEIPLLVTRLSSVLERDPHGDNGIYDVHSLYFDDYKNTCAHDTEGGVSKRYKYRIRYYGHESPLLLECKSKRNGLCNKIHCQLSPEEYQAVINKDYSYLLKSADKPVLQQFTKDLICKGFQQKAIIDYQRTAFVYKPLNVRVTIDRNITVSNGFSKFLQGDYLKYPLQNRDISILEIKYDYILPGYIARLVASPGIVRQSFSKYYNGIKTLREKGGLK